jgi:hypothetical protein
MEMQSPDKTNSRIFAHKSGLWKLYLRFGAVRLKLESQAGCWRPEIVKTIYRPGVRTSPHPHFEALNNLDSLHSYLPDHHQRHPLLFRKFGVARPQRSNTSSLPESDPHRHPWPHDNVRSVRSALRAASCPTAIRVTNVLPDPTSVQAMAGNSREPRRRRRTRTEHVPEIVD